MGVNKQTSPTTWPAPDLTPRRCEVTHGWITKEVYAALEAEAQRRRMHTDALTAMILTDIAGNNLIAALLDR